MALDSFICHRTHVRDAMCLIHVQAYRMVFGFDMSLPVRQHRTGDSITESSGNNLRRLLSLKRPSVYIRDEGSKSYRLIIVRFCHRFMCIISTSANVSTCVLLQASATQILPFYGYLSLIKDFSRFLRRGIGLSQGLC